MEREVDFRGGYGGGGEEQEVAEAGFDAEATGETVIGKAKTAGGLLDDAEVQVTNVVRGQQINDALESLEEQRIEHPSPR